MPNEFDNPPVRDSWDTYWQGAEDSAAFTGGGSSHPLVLSFWDEYFGTLQARRDGLQIIDIASGNGAVVESALRSFGGVLPDFTCLDISDSAIRMLEERFAGVRGVTADAADIPLDSGGFDIATSQFGVEYAGPGALGEVARLLAPGGELAMLLHHRNGVIHRECSASLAAITDMQAAEFLPLCQAMFEAGFDALQGGDSAAYRDAGQAFAPAIRAMEGIISQYGGEVADGTVLRLYRDVRDIHGRMRHYEPADVTSWLDRMGDEIEAYAGRMSSMCEAALDEAQFEEACNSLAAQGFVMVRSGTLGQAAGEPPLAWALIARKE